MPHVRTLGRGLHEVRSTIPDGIARTVFMIQNNEMILLHGFVKKTQQIPARDLDLARKRKADYEKNNPE